MKPGDGNGGDPGDPQKEREALQQVVLHSFTANPLTVKTLGTVSLSWNVTVPDSSPFDITVKLNGQEVAPVGNASRVLTQNTTFTLAAATEHAGRQLKTISVHVDATECRSKTIDPFLIMQPLKTEFDNRFSGSSKFKLRGNGTAVTLGNGTITINVPLEINVPDWFDADMNVFIQLAMRPGAPLSIVATSVSADVSWSFFENLASLGCGHFVESGMTQMAEAFLSDIVNTELAPKVEEKFKEQVKSFTDGLQAGDPQHRVFAVTALILSAAGFKFTACPK
jgi:hypothetical protein